MFFHGCIAKDFSSLRVETVKDALLDKHNDMKPNAGIREVKLLCQKIDDGFFGWHAFRSE